MLAVRRTLEVCSRRRVFLHISFHPVRVLLLPSEAKPCALGGTRLEAGVEAVGRLTVVLGIAVETIGLGNAVDEDRFLECAGALFIENS
jgi:hypothetical protein